MSGRKGGPNPVWKDISWVVRRSIRVAIEAGKRARNPKQTTDRTTGIRLTSGQEARRIAKWERCISCERHVPPEHMCANGCARCCIVCCPGHRDDQEDESEGQST